MPELLVVKLLKLNIEKSWFDYQDTRCCTLAIQYVLPKCLHGPNLQIRFMKNSVYVSPRVSVYMATPWPKTVGFCDLVGAAIVPVSKNLAVTFSNMISKQVVLLLNSTLTLPIPNGTNMASCMDQQSLVMVEYTLAFLSDWTTRRFGLGLGKKSSLHYH